MKNDVRELLENVRDGLVSIEDAELRLKKEPFEDLGYAKVDFHRSLRQGLPEVIYGAGKTVDQMCGIISAMKAREVSPILITRISGETAEKIRKVHADLEYHKDGRLATIGELPSPDGLGSIVVCTAGTSDIPVAEEAAVTAEIYGNRVIRLYDVGVAGLHRLLPHIETIMEASVVITIAGMEGALASVVGGLADCPVIAVPTSVGYGAAFDGLAALLSMLNSCASGVSVVNIDNGFGAGYMANMINHMKVKENPD